MVDILFRERLHDGGIDKRVFLLRQVEHFEADIDEILIPSGEGALDLEDIAIEHVLIVEFLDFPREVDFCFRVILSCGGEILRRVNHRDILGIARHIAHLIAFGVEIVAYNVEIAIGLIWPQKCETRRVDFLGHGPFHSAVVGVHGYDPLDLSRIDGNHPWHDNLALILFFLKHHGLANDRLHHRR